MSDIYHGGVVKLVPPMYWVPLKIKWFTCYKKQRPSAYTMFLYIYIGVELVSSSFDTIWVYDSHVYDTNRLWEFDKMIKRYFYLQHHSGLSTMQELLY